MLVTASTVEKPRCADIKNGGNVRRQRRGRSCSIAEKAKADRHRTVAFDRSGFRYHGRVKAWPMLPAKPGFSSEGSI